MHTAHLYFRNILFLLVLSILTISCEKESGVSTESTYDTGALGTFSGNGSNFDNNGGNYDNGVIDKTGEGYNDVIENEFIKTSEETTSTFSIDADGGSYSNLRSLVNEGLEIPDGAIRTEELINYFQYDYADTETDHPISLNGEVTTCPWNDDHKLLRIGIQGQHIPIEQLPPSNLVFLVDVSGSMTAPNRLPLLITSLKKLVDKLRVEDRIAIVTYASSPSIALPSTSCAEKDKIKTALENLVAGGSTNGSGGIHSAYDIAKENYVQGGNNRIILASDGDFNVGVTSQEELLDLIEEKREDGIFLTTIGVGRGNYQDGKMEQIANHGNGTYEYIDTEEQADKVFIHEFGKLYTIAKDVKVQVEFNPKLVDQYRLIGYENRVLENEDFEDDTKDAGEIGIDQSITALYEIIPAQLGVDPQSEQTFSIDFRYKAPDSDVSSLITLDVKDHLIDYKNSSESTRFAAAVAGLGMVLIDSKFKNGLEIKEVQEWIENADSYDPHGYKQGLKALIEQMK